MVTSKLLGDSGKAVGSSKTWPAYLPAEDSKKWHWDHLPLTVWQGPWRFTVILYLGLFWMPSGSGAAWGLNMQLKTPEIKMQPLINLIAQVSMVASISHPGNLMGGRNRFLDRCSQSHGCNALNMTHETQGLMFDLRYIILGQCLCVWPSPFVEFGDNLPRM